MLKSRREELTHLTKTQFLPDEQIDIIKDVLRSIAKPY